MLQTIIDCIKIFLQWFEYLPKASKWIYEQIKLFISDIYFYGPNVDKIWLTFERKQETSIYIFVVHCYLPGQRQGETGACNKLIHNQFKVKSKDLTDETEELGLVEELRK